MVGGSFASIAESEDQKVAQSRLSARGMAEGRGDSDGLAEGDPSPEVSTLLLSVSTRVGLRGDFESSIEVSVEGVTGLS